MSFHCQTDHKNSADTAKAYDFYYHSQPYNKRIPQKNIKEQERKMTKGDKNRVIKK